MADVIRKEEVIYHTPFGTVMCKPGDTTNLDASRRLLTIVRGDLTLTIEYPA